MITKMPKDITGRIIRIGCDCVFVAYNKLHNAIIIGLTDTKVCVRVRGTHRNSYVYPNKICMIKDY